MRQGEGRFLCTCLDTQWPLSCSGAQPSASQLTVPRGVHMAGRWAAPSKPGRGSGHEPHSCFSVYCHAWLPGK